MKKERRNDSSHRRPNSEPETGLGKKKGCMTLLSNRLCLHFICQNWVKCLLPEQFQAKENELIKTGLDTFSSFPEPCPLSSRDTPVSKEIRVQVAKKKTKQDKMMGRK